jgi:hypothetical protein
MATSPNDDNGAAPNASDMVDFVKLPRRRFLHLTAGAAALSSMSRICEAQSYPSRPITIVVPFTGVRGGRHRSVGRWRHRCARLSEPTNRVVSSVYALP